MNQTADAMVAALGLEPHPEGGFYRETWRADRVLELADYPGPRNAATSILFLLRAGAESRWHRVASEELWLWQGGDPMGLSIRTEDDVLEIALGRDVLQAVVPAGRWQSARPIDGPNGYSLCGCVVVPGFDFADFEMEGE